MKTRERGNFTMFESGFPLDCETLAMIQSQIEMLELIGHVLGDKLILSGCESAANGRRTPGYVMIKRGDAASILYWEGGNAAAGMHVVHELVGVDSNGEAFNTAYERLYLSPGQVGGGENYSWSDFKKPVNLEKLGVSVEAVKSELSRFKTSTETGLSQLKLKHGVDMTDVRSEVASILGQVNDLSEELRDMDEEWRSGDTALNGKLSALKGEITELRRIIDGAAATGVVEPVGTIKAWACKGTPPGGEWLECNGKEYELTYNKEDYPELFDILSDKYRKAKNLNPGQAGNPFISDIKFCVPGIAADDITYYIKARL